MPSNARSGSGESLRSTVVIPTIGRSEQLARCVDAVLSCDPPPDELIVVDQSHGSGELPSQIKRPVVRVVEDRGRGAGRARNEGARAAQDGLLLFVDDDCVPAQDWVGKARVFHLGHPHALLTGSVLPGDGGDLVPSTRTSSDPIDHTGTVDCGALYSGNMVMHRGDFLAFGGFDERFPTAGGEDNDLCYRWLRAGGELRYEPALSVVHLDWRTAAETDRLRAEYGRTQGMFYAKHLRRGDLQMLKFLAWDVSAVIRGRLAGIPSRNPDMPAIGSTVRSIAANWGRFR